MLIASPRTVVFTMIAAWLGLVTAAAAQLPVPQQKIDLQAGGDLTNAAASSVGMVDPTGLALDGHGHLIVADCSRIYTLDLSSDTVTTIAGTGAGCLDGYPGDPGNGRPALAAGVGTLGVVVDSAGDVIFTDFASNQVRELDAATGNIVVLAGNGTAGYSGDGGPAAQAEFNSPWGLALDGAGNLFVADSGDGHVREIAKATGTISTVGTVPFGAGVTLDERGHLLVASLDGQITQITLAGGAETVIAGGGSTPAANGVPAVGAKFSQARDVEVDAAGNIYFSAESPNGLQFQVWQIAAGSTTLIRLAGGGASFSPTGSAFNSSFNTLHKILPDGSGNLYLATNRHILKLDASGNLTSVMGDGAGPESSGNNLFPLTSMIEPDNLVANRGQVLYADASGSVIRELAGTFNIVAGTGTAGYSGDGGPATAADLKFPSAVAEDSAGDIFIADTGNNVIREVSVAGTISTYAGNGTLGGAGDGGPATSASVVNPLALALDAQGNLYIAQGGTQASIRRVDATTHVITTVAGGAMGLDSGDGGPATSATLDSPNAMAFDTQGNLYIVDGGQATLGSGASGVCCVQSPDGTVRRVDAKTGIITTVAGVGDPGGNPPTQPVGFGDGGPATQAALSNPDGIAIDSSGNLYIADFGGAKVREVVAATGDIFTLAGNGQGGASGDKGPAVKAEFRPSSVSLDTIGQLWIADKDSGHIWLVPNAVGGPVYSFSNSPDFGQVLVKTAGTPITFTITNPGLAPLVISGITAAQGANPDFTEANNCGTLAPGQSCTVTLAFTPSQTGTEQANFNVNNNAGPSGFSVNGQGANPAAPVVGIKSLVFASQATATTSPGQTVVLTNGNTKDVALTNIAVTVTGPFGATNSCPTSLAGGRDCSIVVRFAPTAAGSASGTLSISSSAATQTVALTGTGATAAASAAIFPSSLEFTNQIPGTVSNAQAVVVTNSGSAALAISAIAASGDFSATNNCGASLAPLAYCSIAVNFKPSASGIRTGSLTITDNAGDSPETVALTGMGPVTPPVITTLAGEGPENIPATSAGFAFNQVRALAFDSQGDLYVSDYVRVLKVTPAGLASVFAGSGAAIATGDGGLATAAGLGLVVGLVADGKGDVFISASDRVREVTPDGKITTYAGTGRFGFSGDGGPAAQAQLGNPFGLAVDTTGDLFIADSGNLRVREVNAATGVITTFAGNGTQGQGVPVSGPATGVALNLPPENLSVDQAGDVFINSFTGYVGEVPAGSGMLQVLPPSFPEVFVDAAGTMYGIASTDIPGGRNVGSIIFAAFAADNSSDIGGGSTKLPQALGGAASAAFFDRISAAVVSPGGKVTFAADGYVLQVDAKGNLQAIAGNGSGDTADGVSALANSFYGYALAQDAAGNLFIGDDSGGRVRELLASTGVLVTVAGGGSPASGNGDGGPATQAKLSAVFGLARDGAGNLYVSDSVTVREINASTGVISTIAGNGTSGEAGDGGPATAAELGFSAGLAVDSQGDVFIADQGITNNNQNTIAGTPRVREVNAKTGIITTVAGGGTSGPGDGGPATSAQLYEPNALAFDSAGNLYIADAGGFDPNLGPILGSSRVRKVNLKTGIITTVAGGGTTPGQGSGGPATQAELVDASSVRVDGAGNLYVAESGGRIWQVNATTGNIAIVAGVGGQDVGGDGSAATAAGIGAPNDFVLTNAGDLEFIADGRVRKVANLVALPYLSAENLSFGSQETGVASAAQAIMLANPGGSALAITGIAASGTGFAETNTCGSSLAAGAACSIAVTFTPAAAGAASGALRVTLGGGPLSAGLSGTGVVPAPAAVLSPTSLAFASELTGDASAAQTVTLTNSGSAALTISAIAAAGDFAETNTCGGSVAAGKSCTIAVTFKPTATGSRTGTFTVTDNASDSPEKVALTGTGADLTIAPTAGSSNTASVSAGSPATYALAFTPVSGASGSFALTCSGAPTGAVCTPSPATISLSGAAPAAVTVTVTTTAHGLVLPWLDLELLAGLGLVVLAIVCAPTRKRRWLIPAAGAALLALSVGCGGNTQTSPPPPPPPPSGTPAGTYTLVVTATGPNGQSRTTNLTLTVK